MRYKVIYLVLALTVFLTGCLGGTTREHELGSLVLTLQLTEEIEASAMVVELAKAGTALPPEEVKIEGHTASWHVPRIQPGEWEVLVQLFNGDLQVGEATGKVVIQANSEEVLDLTATPFEGSVVIVVGWERVPEPVVPPHSAKIDVIMQHLGDRVMVYPQFRGVQSASRNVVGFNLYRSSQPDGEYTYVSTSTWDANGLVLEDRSIVSGAVYYYKLTSLAPDGRESWPSSSYSLNVAEVGQPLQPAGGEMTSRRPHFEWTGADGYSNYTVHLSYRNSDRPVYQPIAVAFAVDVSGPRPLAIPLQDLEPGEYQWYVMAHEEDAGNVRFFVTDMDYFTIGSNS